MRISDWSSDVCSSDLLDAHRAVAFQRLLAGCLAQVGKRIVGYAGQRVVLELTHAGVGDVDQPYFLRQRRLVTDAGADFLDFLVAQLGRSEEHTSELQSLMRISYPGFSFKNKNKTTK